MNRAIEVVMHGESRYRYSIDQAEPLADTLRIHGHHALIVRDIRTFVPVFYLRRRERFGEYFRSDCFYQCSGGEEFFLCSTRALVPLLAIVFIKCRDACFLEMIRKPKFAPSMRNIGTTVWDPRHESVSDTT